MNNQPEPAFAPAKRSKGTINTDAPYCAEMTKTAVLHLRNMNAKSYCNSCLAATYWDASTANGVIHPQQERTVISLGVTPDELPEIGDGMTQTLTLEELEAGALPDWAYEYTVNDDGTIRIQSYTPLFLAWVKANRETLKKDRISINHEKVITRYAKGLPAGLARAISIWATGLTPSIFNDFGFSKHPHGQAPYQIWHTDRNGRTKGTKLQHNAQFSHPLLLDRTPAGYAKLAKITELTEDMVQEPFCAVIALGAISDKFLLDGDHQAILEAVDEINKFGWHRIQVRERGTDMAQWQLIVTPTLAFHNFVWKMDFFAAGPMLTRWEVENGFIPFLDDAEQGDDPMRYAPALGYHYLYGIRSARTGEFVTVGQTTTSLVTRKNSHERAGSNADANDGILEILCDPEDHLEIVHFATVHHSITSAKEMSLANAMVAMGHNIKNKILTVEQNNRTVKLDARFGDADYIKRNWWAIQEKLDLQLENYGKEILFMIDSLPEVPTPDTTTASIDPEAVRWLFEPVAYLAPDEDDDNTHETRTHDELMWEAEERGAYSEIAA